MSKDFFATIFFTAFFLNGVGQNLNKRSHQCDSLVNKILFNVNVNIPDSSLVDSFYASKYLINEADTSGLFFLLGLYIKGATTAHIWWRI
jgi:hypothetical protein